MLWDGAPRQLLHAARGKHLQIFTSAELLAAAVAAHARFIVSGDRHLLTLGQFQGITVLTVRQALQHLGVA